MRDTLKDIKQKGLTSVSPEQKRALQMLLKNWPSGQQLRNPPPLPSSFRTGYIRSSSHNVTVEDLPSEEFWIWRQCNAKVATQIDDITTVIIQKFNTRDKKSVKNTTNMKRPTYKLWNLRVLQKNIAFTFIFCEKGIDEDVKKTTPPSLNCQIPYFCLPTTGDLNIPPLYLPSFPEMAMLLQQQQQKIEYDNLDASLLIDFPYTI